MVHPNGKELSTLIHSCSARVASVDNPNFFSHETLSIIDYVEKCTINGIEYEATLNSHWDEIVSGMHRLIEITSMGIAGAEAQRVTWA